MFCKKLGEQNYHENGICEAAMSVYCRRCGQQGHMTSTCGKKNALWERPTTYEELIPAHVRLQWNIQTHTRIEYPEDHATSEINDLNTIAIPDPHIKGGYEELKTFADRHKIKVEKVTKPSIESLLDAVMTWGAQRGQRVVILRDISATV